MPVYNPRGRAGTAQWYITASTPEDEEDILASDDEYEPTDDDGDDEEEQQEEERDGRASVDRDDATSEGSSPLSTEEVDELMEDAFGEESSLQKMTLESQVNIANEAPVSPTQVMLRGPSHLDMNSFDRKTRVGLHPHRNTRILNTKHKH